MPADLLEISDVIVDYDVTTFERRPVKGAQAAERLANNGQARAARFVARLPTDAAGDLQADVCDQILLRAHTELQRLSEELLQADRVRMLLLPLIETLRRAGDPPPYRVVDVGCGLGYMVRALAGHGRLGRDVELVGCDMNRSLVQAGRALAAAESLVCDLRVANAFALAEPAHVFISTGVVHHFRGAALDAFFEGQRRARAFVHFDIQPSPLSPVGSWIFHQTRMREPLARHDGVVSAARAHTAATLLAAARAHSSFACRTFDRASSLATVLLRPMHAVLGVAPDLDASLMNRLGPLAQRLGPPS